MEEEGDLGVGCLQSRASRAQPGEFVGQSGAFRSIIETIEMVAMRKSSVIISGETGTGKEMVARQIHARSHRARQGFVPVDCTALNGNILESQLFGHVKGSFTGAVMDTVGFPLENNWHMMRKKSLFGQKSCS